MKTDEAGSSHGFFPKVCIFCNQHRKTVRRKSHNACKILTKEAEQNIKRAANVKNDLPLLCQIQDIDLIHKELMIHKKCYLDCTHILDSTTLDPCHRRPEYTEQLPRQLGDIESVRTFVNEAVLEQNQTVSITVLHRLYGTEYGQENETIYRNKLKKVIFDEYGDSLKF